MTLKQIREKYTPLTEDDVERDLREAAKTILELCDEVAEWGVAQIHGKPFLTPEINEEHHAMMNGPRIQQSLPKEYIDNLVKLGKLYEEQKKQGSKLFEEEYLSETTNKTTQT